MRALVLAVVVVTLGGASVWAALHPSDVSPGAANKKPKEAVASFQRQLPQVPLIVRNPVPGFPNLKTTLDPRDGADGSIGGGFVGWCPGGVLLELGRGKTATCPRTIRDVASAEKLADWDFPDTLKRPRTERQAYEDCKAFVLVHNLSSDATCGPRLPRKSVSKSRHFGPAGSARQYAGDAKERLKKADRADRAPQ